MDKPTSRRTRATQLLAAVSAQFSNDVDASRNLFVQYAWDRRRAQCQLDMTAHSHGDDTTATSSDYAKRVTEALLQQDLPCLLLALRQGQERLGKQRVEQMLFADAGKDDDTSNTIHRRNSSLLASMQEPELQASRESLQESLEAIVLPSSKRGSTSSNQRNPNNNVIFPIDDRVFVRDNENSSSSSRPSTPSTDASRRHSGGPTYSCRVLSLGRHDMSLPSHVSIASLACAAHHTVFLSTTGTVYSMGHGKGGRLGTGNEQPQLRPTPVMEYVTAIAAGPTHSLMVQATTGHVYACGANGFGQTGLKAASLVPQRVTIIDHDKETVRVTAVAAGDRHSVARSTTGQLYSWGDNRAGQLGIYNSYGQSCCPVRPVNTGLLYTSIAASSVATVAVTHHGVVYGWGHGHAVPLKVTNLPGRQRHVACGPYHTVAVDASDTAEGGVYTWGFWHAVGRKRSTPVPELVPNVPPVAAVACAEHQTALVTRTGRVYAVGGGSGPNANGKTPSVTTSDGAAAACWRPEPQRIPGIVRAVAVGAVAQECTAVLVATTHPEIVYSEKESLAERAAKVVMKNVDISNVVPLMTMAERLSCDSLRDYCTQFVRSNMDLVLWNGAQKGELDTYLSEQIREAEPDTVMSLLEKVVMVGSQQRCGELCSFDEWTTACARLLEEDNVLRKLCDDFVFEQQHLQDERARRQLRSQSISGDHPVDKKRSDSVYCSQRCDELLSSLDVLSMKGAKQTLEGLTKEVRAIRKRLGQIERLLLLNKSELTAEQARKIERKSLLELDLEKLLPAIELVEGVIRDFVGSEDAVADPEDCEDKAAEQQSPIDTATRQVSQIPEIEISPEAGSACVNESEDPKTLPASRTLRCTTCQIVCPDDRSFELHLNGRKHRNRVSQVLAEEQKNAAKSILLEQQKQSLLKPVPRTPPTKPKPANAWQARSSSASKAPKFKLPPPPHPVGELGGSVQSLCSKPKAGLNLELPTGSAGAMQTAPWAAAPVMVLGTQLPKASPSQKSLHEIMAEEETSRSRLTPSVEKKSSRVKTPGVKSHSPARGVPTLGAFLPVTPSASSTLDKSGWNTPSSGADQVSFREIQKEEGEFQADHAYAKTSGTWFIEKKERAGSFNAIQEREAAEREHECMIAEQVEIERQIYQQLARDKEAKEKAKRKKPRSRRKPKGKQTEGSKTRPANR